MKEAKIEYIVTNAFSEISEADRKEKINKAIRNLCVQDIEKTDLLDYNINNGSVSDPKKGGTLVC